MKYEYIKNMTYLDLVFRGAYNIIYIYIILRIIEFVCCICILERFIYYILYVYNLYFILFIILYNLTLQYQPILKISKIYIISKIVNRSHIFFEFLNSTDISYYYMSNLTNLTSFSIVFFKDFLFFISQKKNKLYSLSKNFEYYIVIVNWLQE